MQPTIPMPLAIEDITAEWVSQALSLNFPGVRVREITVEPLPGFKPNKVRVTLDRAELNGSTGLPPSIVVKGGFARHLKSDYQQDLTVALDLGMQMEARAYRDLVPQIAVNTPLTYYVDADFTRGSGIVVMEDLNLRGAAFFTAFRTMTFAQAAGFIEQQAIMHAHWWDSPQFAPGAALGPQSDFGRCTTEIHERYLASFFEPEIWATLIHNPHNAGLPNKLLDRSRMEEGTARLKEFNRKVPKTIIHGDEHLKNFYVDASGEPGLADYNARMEPWSNGFAYFMTACLDIIDRRNWERALLSHYLTSLRKLGVTPPDFDEAWLSYRCAVQFPLLCWMINNSKLQPANVNCAYTARVGAAAVDLDTHALLGG